LLLLGRVGHVDAASAGWARKIARLVMRKDEMFGQPKFTFPVAADPFLGLGRFGGGECPSGDAGAMDMIAKPERSIEKRFADF
jgi:hypothetical protein